MTEETLSDAQKEQIKLRATFLNNIGIGVMLVGVFTPIVRLMNGDMSTQVGIVSLAGSLLGCFFLGLALHFAGTKLLGRLSQ